MMPPANPMIANILGGDTTREHLRVSYAAFQRLVGRCGPQKRWGWSLEFEVRMHMVAACNQHGWFLVKKQSLNMSVVFQVMVFLFWLACGTSYRVVSVAFTMPRTTVFRVIEKVLQKVVSLMREIVRLPSLNSLPAVGQGFARLAGSAVFSQCAGAIDGCHIRIMCPPDLHDQYINRKLSYSIQMQGIVDNNGKFVDILAGYPGSVHDTRVFRNSAIFRQSLYPPAEYFIIGDSGYPCRKEPVTIITPFKEPGLTVEKRAFNHALSKARIVVEQSFGAMKTRWRSIFTNDLEVKLHKAVIVIAACALMHNICLSEGDVILVGQNDILPPLPPRRMQRDEAEAVELRNVLLRLYTIEQNQ